MYVCGKENQQSFNWKRNEHIYVCDFQLFIRHLSKRSYGQAHVMSVMDRLPWHALRSEADREFHPNSGT